MAAAEAMAAATLERLEAPLVPRGFGGSPPRPPRGAGAALPPLPHPLGPAVLGGGQGLPPLSAELESLPEKEQMRALAELGAELLLCGPGDTALIQGSAPPEQQLQFLQDLLDAASPPESAPQSSPPTAAPFLQELLETPEGRAALRPPRLPRAPLQPSGSPPGPRRPLPKLQQELGGVQRGLEELQEQLSNLGGSSTPDPPNLGVLGGALTSLAAEFGASELRGPPRPPKNPQIWGGGSRVPPVGRGLRQLGQVLGSLAQLGASAGEVTRLGGVSEAIAPQIPPLARRFQPPPDRTIPAPQIPPLARRFQPPPDRTIPAPQIPPLARRFQPPPDRTIPGAAGAGGSGWDMEGTGTHLGHT